MIRLETREDGVVLPVRAQPGARANGIRGEHDGQLKVGVTQIAEKGKANKAIVAVLCKELDLKKSQVELISGKTSQQKQFLIRGVLAAELAARLTPLLKG